MHILVLIIFLHFTEKKVNRLLSMTKKQTFVDAFAALSYLDLSEYTIADIEELTCHTYGYPKEKKH